MGGGGGYRDLRQKFHLSTLKPVLKQHVKSQTCYLVFIISNHPTIIFFVSFCLIKVGLFDELVVSNYFQLPFV